VNVGKFINAIKIGEVIIPKIAKIMLIIPAAYSFLPQAKKPKKRAIGLNRGDSINIPMNPKNIPSVP
jgi:hypothetical protein